MRKISTVSKDGLVKALNIICENSKVKIIRNSLEDELVFGATWYGAGLQDLNKLQKMQEDLEKAQRIIKYLNELKLEVDYDREVSNSKEAYNKKINNWTKILKRF